VTVPLSRLGLEKENESRSVLKNGLKDSCQLMPSGMLEVLRNELKPLDHVTRAGGLGPSADQSGTSFASHIHKPFQQADLLVTTTYVDVRPGKSMRAAPSRTTYQKTQCITDSLRTLQ
jgi:hypothetical protein